MALPNNFKPMNGILNKRYSGKLKQKNPLNAQAWEYYYRANRNLLVCSGKNELMVDGMTDSLQGIMNKMGQLIPETFEYNYLIYYNGIYNGDREKYFPYLLKAYSIDSTKTEIYADLVVQAETNGNAIKKKNT